MACQVNTAGNGVSWLLPKEDAAGKLLLLQALTPADEAARLWSNVYACTEQVMATHFGALFCGGCECFDVLAGQVLT